MIPIVVSPEPRLESFVAERYSAVVNVSDTPGLTFLAQPIPVFWFPILETAYWGFAPFFGLANVLDQFKGSGKPVLVHCHGGLNRSPSVSYAVLQAEGYGDVDISGIASAVNIPAVFQLNLKRGLIPKDIIRFLQLRKRCPRESILGLLKLTNSPYATVCVP